MKNESLDRKDFFKKLSLFGISAIGASTLLKACGGSSEEPASEPDVEPQVADDPCSDLSGLSDSEKQMRESLQYVAETPNPEQRCDNCALYTEPENGSPCGGCTIMAGPFHPGGWCLSWAAKS